MENSQSLQVEIKSLKTRVDSSAVPVQLRLQLESSIERLSMMISLGSFTAEYDSLSRHIDWVVSLPWDKRSVDNLNLKTAQEVLERNHYGMWRIKDRILEYLSVLNLNSSNKSLESNILCFVGLPGIGKTSIASSIAQSMGRSFIRIPFGGIGEVASLRGTPHYLSSSEPGVIMKSLRRFGTKNPVILLDEVDRVADDSRASIMGVLLELLDPEQNGQFVDYYIDFPFDLSEVMFICTANNTHGISNAVLDRLEVIEMPSYTDDEKRIIGRDYLLPRVIARTGLTQSQINIGDNLWPKIIRPLGYDSGIRTLERTLEGICRKVARKIVEGEGSSYELTEGNIKEFLPTW